MSLTAASRTGPATAVGQGYANTGIHIGDVYTGSQDYLIEESPPPQDLDIRWMREQPSRLLDARSQVVSFFGRDDELRTLTHWRDTPAQPESHLLVHGPGGQGKTRLAAEFAEMSRAAGWKTVHAQPVGRHNGQDSDGSDHTVQNAVGLLLIVDYADRWPHTLLLRLFADPALHESIPVRVLLLSRTIQWWPAVRGELAERRIRTVDLPLGHAARDSTARLAAFVTARDRFTSPDYYDIDDPSSIPPPDTLDHPDFGLILTVHMAALVAVDAYKRGEQPPNEPHELSAYLLDREYMAWQRHYDGGRSGKEYSTPPSVIARTVFTATLTGATEHATGVHVLEKLELEGHPHRVLADHRVCYPPANRATVLEPLYPDRLSEDFLGLLLPGHEVSAYDPDPWAVTAPTTLLTSEDGAPSPFAPRAVTFIAAAAERWPHLGATCLYPLLLDTPELAIHAGSTALSILASHVDVDIDVLERIEKLFPEESSVDLGAGIADVTQRLTDHHLAHTGDPSARAKLYIKLGVRLSHAGLDERAITANMSAVEILRKLTKSDPESTLPDLALSLHTLSNCLATLSRWEAALAPAEESVAIERRLVVADMGLHLPRLSRGLTNLGITLCELGRLDDGLTRIQEAVKIQRLLVWVESMDLINEQLAAQNTHTGDELTTFAVRIPVVLFNLPDLASSLNNLCTRLADKERHQDALTASRESADIFSRLAEEDPDAYLPNYASSLANLGNRLAAVGKYRDALQIADRVVRIRRELTRENQQAHLPGLALSLHNLGIMFANLRQYEEALVHTQEALSIRRKLALERPPGHLPNLATSLENIGYWMSQLGRHQEALAPTEEAVAICRLLAAANPAAHLAGLASTLLFLSARLKSLGRLEDALAAARESVAARRELVETEHDANISGLANSLFHLGSRLVALARFDEALAPSQEAVAIYRRLAQRSPDAHLSVFAEALGNLESCLTALDRPDDAIGPEEEAVAIYRRLALENETPAARLALDKSLSYLVNSLAQLNRFEEALTYNAEAVEVERELAAANPTLFAEGLGLGLWTFAGLRVTLGVELPQALPAIQEAIDIFVELTERRPDLIDTLRYFYGTKSDVLKGLRRQGRTLDGTS